MTIGRQPGSEVLGFLTVLEHDALGLVGGLLLLNAAGRPLEFHCTAPVRANRAQQILFGPTLASYLYGEQIGTTLLSAAAAEPLVVYTDVERALAVRDFISLPVALVLAAGAAGSRPDGEPTSTPWRVDAARAPHDHLAQFTLGSNQLAVATGRQPDQETICSQLDHLADFDLLEPFDRIREAVAEAHQGARAA